MSLRSMSRHPGRTIFLFLGIMFTFALLGSPWSMMEMAETMLYDQYEKVETYDVKVNLTRPVNRQEAVNELSRFPGTRKAEALAEIPVILKNQWHKKEVALLGIPQNSTLYTIRDTNGNRIKPPTNGSALGDACPRLDAQVGTRLQLRSP